MRKFSQVNDATARGIDRTMASMVTLTKVSDLEERFMLEAPAIVPGDCVCWNNWSVDLTHQISVRTNGYEGKLRTLHESFVETLAYHPLLSHFADTADDAMKTSDFASPRTFRENPLFREVYRHVDSYYQIAYTASVLPDFRILLTWNRRAMDFTEQDRQVFQYMGERLGTISRHIDKRERLETKWRTLCDFVDSRLSIGPASSLGGNDLALLAGLMKCCTREEIAAGLGIRRDSVDKRLGSIREKLGLENHHQLLSALAELKSNRP